MCTTSWEADGFAVSFHSTTVSFCLHSIPHGLILSPFHSTQSSLKDNSEALATLTGIVDGTGNVYIGAAIGQVSGGINVQWP